MKNKFLNKMGGVFCIVSLLLFSSLFVACSSDDDNLDDLLGPANVWCQMPIEITKSSSSESVREAATGEKETVGYIAFIYADKTLTNINGGSGKLKSNITIEPGLTILLWAEKDQSKEESSILKGLTATQYLMKTFAESEEELKDGDSDSDPLKFSVSKRKLWTICYYAKGDLRKAENQNAHPKAPVPLLTSSSYSSPEQTAEVVKNFSWKNVLKQYLISTL